MKTRFFKAITVLVLVSALAFSMTGCEALDYREALAQYNAGNFDAAIDMFHALGDYEDSAALFTRSHYLAAIQRMEAGNYAEALPRFIKLGDYEDSAQRVTECTYQLALAAFDAGDLATAESHFLEVPEYRQAPEYLRKITWQKFFDALSQKGAESGAAFTIQREQEGRTIGITTDQATGSVLFSIGIAWEDGGKFHDDLTVSFTRDNMEAAFTGTSSFSMDFLGSPIGSQQKSSGTLDIPSLTADTRLVVTTFEKTVTDNLGKTSTSTDPADSLMQDDMQENYRILMTAVPQILAEEGIPQTLAEIGFIAMQ